MLAKKIKEAVLTRGKGVYKGVDYIPFGMVDASVYWEVEDVLMCLRVVNAN